MARETDAVKKLEQAIADYLENVIRSNRSKNTIESYRAVLMDFYGFFYEGSQWRYADPSFTTIQAWRNDMMDRGLSVATISHHLTILKTFFEYSSEVGGNQHYASNPVSRRLFPGNAFDRKQPYDIFLKNEQISMLWKFDQIIDSRHRRKWERDYAIVMVLITSKIRCSELLSVTPNDLDWENEEIEIEHGKGDKYRTAPFPLIAQQAVKIYLYSGARPFGLGDDEPLFGQKKNGKWVKGTRSWLSHLVERHIERVTGVDKITAHDLRHIGSYLDLNAGKSISELQSELGHANPVMTQRYSGKLTGRKNRGSVKSVFAEMDIQSQRNAVFLQHQERKSG